MITFRQLQPGRCHYPHGDIAPYRFCGKSTEDGKKYCPEHHTLCHAGFGKSWEQLVKLVYHTDFSVRTRQFPRESERAVDEVLR